MMLRRPASLLPPSLFACALVGATFITHVVAPIRIMLDRDIALRELPDGNRIPALGLGVFRIKPGKDTYKAVTSGLAMGYRHIDTAQGYENEAAVGRAILDSGIPRSELFVTTKLSTVWVGHATFKQTIATLNASLAKLQMDYVDLYLIHSPRDVENRLEQWRALMHVRELGLVRSIGVSDYEVDELSEIVDASVRPSVLQIEINPWLFKRRAAEVAFCAQHDMVIEAWGVLTVGAKLDDATIGKISERHAGRSSADVLLAWSLQKGFVPLFTSQNPEHQRSNMELARAISSGSWALSQVDIAELDALGESPYYTAGRDISGDGQRRQ